MVFGQKLFIPLLISLMGLASLGCKEASNGRESENGAATGTEREEPGSRLTENEKYDAVRRGVRLIMAYDTEASAFVGSVANVTDQPVVGVRVEVHLSNGTELGPTPRLTLAPGQVESVWLPAAGQSFRWWNAHAESGEAGGEHGGAHGEHGGEHDHDNEHGNPPGSSG